MSARRHAVRFGAGPLSLAAVAALLCPTALKAMTAEQALLERLQQAYPTATGWQLRRLSRAPEAPPRSGTDGGVVDAPQVRVLGARSRVDVDGVSLWYAVDGVAPVLVARRELRRGTPVRPEDLALETRPVFSTRCAALAASPSAAGPWDVVGPRPVGAVLCVGDLRHPAAVTDGAAIDVAVRRGAVVLETRGVALERAEVGERVRVRVGGGTEALLGRVVAPGRVSIDE